MNKKCGKKKCCEVTDLLESVQALEEQVKLLSDERDSLWGMLDEIKASEVANFEEALQSAHKEMQIDRLLSGPAAGEA